MDCEMDSQIGTEMENKWNQNGFNSTIFCARQNKMELWCINEQISETIEIVVCSD